VIRIAVVDGLSMAPTLRDPGMPPGAYYVLGDNAEASIDSREFGCVPAAWVYGVVVRRLASIDSSSNPVPG
jgi:signal peptidase I